MFKYLFCILMVFISYTSSAQTPEQLEMMRSLGVGNETSSDEGLYDGSKNEERLSGDVSSSNESSKEKSVSDPNEKLVPLADMSVYTKPENEMTREEMAAKARDFLKGKITLKIKNITVYNTAFGGKVCTADVELKNDSGKTLKDLYVTYRWGEHETFVKFSNVRPSTKNVLEIGSADDYCSHFYQDEPQADIKSCKIDGLSQEACKNRIIVF